jgi:colicin import membrane protein
MNKTLKTALAVVPFLLTVACTDPAKAPAQAAIQAGDAAVASLTDEVAKFAPDQVKSVKDALASAKAAAAKEDWKGALAAAQNVKVDAEQAVVAANAKKEELARAAAAKAAEAKAAWEQAQKELPGKIDALKKQIAGLSKAKKLPAGVTKADVAKAKDGLTVIEAGYKSASEQAKTDVPAAAASGKALVAQADATSAALAPKKAAAPAKAPAKKKKK